MQRLKDTYYTDKVLDGTPAEEGVKQLSPVFNQGDDGKLSFYLNYNCAPVDTSKHILNLTFKKSTAANNLLWQASLNNGLFAVEGIPGYFYILIPSEVTGQLIPGLYYMDVSLTEKLGTGEAVRDVTVVILSQTIQITLSTASPNPKLKNTQITETSFDPWSGFTTFTITMTEPTLPVATDTTRF